MNTKINYPCIVRPKGVDSILNVQNINDIEKYLIGEYDVEILTLPRFRFSVEILPIETAKYSYTNTRFSQHPTSIKRIWRFMLCQKW